MNVENVCALHLSCLFLLPAAADVELELDDIAIENNILSALLHVLACSLK